MWLFRHEVAVINALYARGEGRLSYQEINKFSNILASKWCENHIPFIVSDENDGEHDITFMNVRYIRAIDEVLLCTPLTEEIVNKVNSIYDEKMQKLIVEAREEYLKKENNTRKKSK
ncbi:MAG: hypothetical protein IKX00_02450 [Bacilli bacterium]|nr:hypothetical protein [Bacilli bacterium]